MKQIQAAEPVIIDPKRGIGSRLLCELIDLEARRREELPEISQRSLIWPRQSEERRFPAFGIKFSG